jgi:hypothetical protein
MATVANSTTFPEKRVAQITWTPLNEADAEGAAERCSRYARVTIQVKGTFANGTLHIRGSNDGSNFKTLTVDGSNALTFISGAGTKEVLEVPLYLKPVLVSGSGCSLTVIAAARA